MAKEIAKTTVSMRRLLSGSNAQTMQKWSFGQAAIFLEY